MMDIFKLKNLGIFAGGVLFGTAGIKILSSRDAKKVYTNCTAAALRAKECVMKTAVTIQENAEDIYAEAQQINEERAAQEAANVEEDVEENAGAKDFDEVEKE
ncbi:MAG TPA: hypothetical protein H9711_08670 [Candidatus Mediterraneibacter intestinavium]|nr:hypothetical protein [Candidatus Mediterraneibacter intestinavium]